MHTKNLLIIKIKTKGESAVRALFKTQKNINNLKIKTMYKNTKTIIMRIYPSVIIKI